MKRIAILLLAVYAGSMFLESFTFANMGSVTRLVGYLAFMAGVATMVTLRGIQRPGLGHLLLTAFVCFSLMSVLWSVDPDMTLDRTLMYSMQLAFLWLVLQVIESQEDMNIVMGGYVIGSVLASAGNLRAFNMGSQAIAHSDRYSAATLDPNEFALMVVLSIPMAWYLGFAAERPIARAFFRLCPLIMISGVILTGSRGGTVAMCIALMIIPLCFNQISTLTKSIVVVAVISAVVGGAALLPEASVRRFSSIGSEAMSGSMAGRREIWAAGWEKFKQHPILGVGTGGFAESISLANSQNPVAHNTYLSVATELGVIGFLIYFLALVRMGLDAFSMPKPERWLWVSVLFAWMIGVCTLTWEHTKATWLIFALILTRARLFNSEQEHAADEWESEAFLPLQS